MEPVQSIVRYRDQEAACPAPGLLAMAMAEIRKQLTYRPAAINSAGISDQLSDIKVIRDGRRHESKAGRKRNDIYLWADIFGVGAEDEIEFTLRDLNDRPVLERLIRLPKRCARQFEYVGIHLGTTFDAAGGYTETITI